MYVELKQLINGSTFFFINLIKGFTHLKTKKKHLMIPTSTSSDILMIQFIIYDSKFNITGVLVVGWIKHRHLNEPHCALVSYNEQY